MPLYEQAMVHVRALREAGYAVIVWTPEELRSAKPHKVEDRSVELGWDVIEDLQTEENNNGNT